MTYREPDSDIIGRIESKRIEPPGFDRHEHSIDCPINRWKHPWRLSECNCGGGEMTKDDLDDGNRKGE